MRTGIKPRRTLIVWTGSAPDSVDRLMLDRLQAERIVFIDELQSVLFEMHKKVSGTVSNNILRQLRAHNRKTDVVQPKFPVGDLSPSREGRTRDTI